MTRNNSNKVGRIAKLVLALFLLFGASQSYAACALSDLAGTWYFNGVTGDTLFAEFWETDFCKIKINSNGKVVASSSQCQFRDFDGEGIINIIGGTLTLNSSCRIKGNVRYSFGEINTNLNIDDARLDRGKTVITMVGRLGIEPDIVSFFTGVKK